MSGNNKEKWAGKAFLICTVLVGVVGIILFFTDFAGSVKTAFTSGEAMSEVKEDLNVAVSIITEAKDLVPDFGDNLSSFFSDLESQYNSEIGDAESSSSSTSANASTVSYNTTGTVIRVVDGDTYILDIDGEETRVRLIGVDTPESVAPSSYHKENTEEGAEISEIVKDYIKEGDKLGVEYDVGRTDTYGRTLAYLYFESGTMVQEWLLSNGYAQVMTIQPNSKYSEKFVQIEQEAMTNGIGIWAYTE